MVKPTRQSILIFATVGSLGLLALAFAAPPSATVAPAPAPAAAPTAAVRAEIARRLPGAHPEDVRVSTVPGVFEVARGADLVYVTADGRHAFSGDLYDLTSQVNLSEQRRRELRSHILASMPENQMIVFSPKDPKYTVTVFTDVDCGYCRKLHSEIAKYNDLGIRVRYLFFPRTGPDTESWAKANAVWCSANRNDALTRAKRGETISAPNCAPTPVAKDYEMGQDFGVHGTPAIVLASGELLPGYLPPALLSRRLAAESH